MAAGLLYRPHGHRSRADSLILSTMHGQTSDRDFPTFRIRARRSGTGCSLSEPVTGYRGSLRLDNLEFIAGDAVAAGTGNGVTLIFGTASDTGFEHATLGVQAGAGNLEGTRVSALVSYAGGELTGDPLTGSATWLGLMIGLPTIGSSRDGRLEGMAALNYDMAAGGGMGNFRGNGRTLQEGPESREAEDGALDWPAIRAWRRSIDHSTRVATNRANGSTSRCTLACSSAKR